MTAPRPPFPQYLDSSMLSAFKACPHKFWREYIQHWKSKEPSVHLHAGASFASGVEAARRAFWDEQLPREDAVAAGLEALLVHYGSFECPPDSAKSAERTAGAYEFYMDQYPLGEDGAAPIKLATGKYGIELSFAEPLPEVANPETGDPILFVGRLDQASKFADGVFIQDEKTTSSLGATWSKQWDLRSQFSGYAWGLQKSSGIKANGILVRGVSILKTKYDTQQAITYRADWQVDEWLDSTLYWVKQIMQSWEADKWVKVLDHACTDYGGCQFRQVCLSAEPQGWLDTYFERRVWNPLERTETKL